MVSKKAIPQPRPSREEVAAVWAEFEETRALPLRNWLVAAYLPLAGQIANRIASGLPRSIDAQDLQSVGVFRLIEAVERFAVGIPLLENRFPAQSRLRPFQNQHLK